MLESVPAVDACLGASQRSVRDQGAPRRILCVVVNFNRRDLLLRCLGRLLDHVLVPSGHRLDVLVVDNDSDDGSRAAVAERFPGVTVINTGSNIGGSGAFRRGLRFAVEHDYDLVWLHDNDAFSSRGVLGHYLSALDRLGGKALVGGSMHQLEAPRLVNEAGGRFGRNRSIDIELSLAGHLSTPVFRRNRRPLDVDFLAFANMLMPVEIVRRIGLPEDFFLHYDDIEFCLRAGAAGYRVLAIPAAVFWHESAHAKPKTWINYYDARNSLWTVAMRLPHKLRRRRLIWLRAAAMHLAWRRLALTRAILDGIRDQALGITGRVEVPTKGTVVHDIADGITPLLGAHDCKYLAVDYHALQALPRPYRNRWLACMVAVGDRAFVCCDLGRQFALYPARISRAAQRQGRIRLGPPMRRADARRIASDALLVRPDFRTGARARLVLRAFRRVLCLHGAHVVDYGAGASGRDVARMWLRWLSSWGYVFDGQHSKNRRGKGA